MLVGLPSSHIEPCGGDIRDWGAWDPQNHVVVVCRHALVMYHGGKHYSRPLVGYPSHE